MDIEIRRLGEMAGAEILGLDFNHPLDGETVDTINQAFLDHHVVCIRDQDISIERYLEVAAVFGEVQPQKIPQFAHPETDLISVLSPSVNRESDDPNSKLIVRGTFWHTDHSYHRAPVKATLLHAVKIPSKGGDTRFLNMHAAYEALPDAMKQRIEGLRGVHCLTGRRNFTGRKRRTDDEVDGPTAAHPLVRTHDDTGRKAIYMNPNRMNGIDGWSDADSDALLDALNEHCFDARFEYRHRWKPHDMLIWDNRCLMHAASDDYHEPRHMHRALLRGTAPH